MNHLQAKHQNTYFTRCLIGLVFTFFSSSVLAQSELSANRPSPQFVATSIIWSVSNIADDSQVRFSAGRFGESKNVLYDFTEARNSFRWTPSEEGNYVVTASILDSSGNTETISNVFEIRSPAVSSPRATNTTHPLVALYSAPSCQPGERMKVHFHTFSPPRYTATPFKDCDGVFNMSFYLGGLYESTDYVIRHQIVDSSGDTIEWGPRRTYTSRSISVPLPVNIPDDPITPDASIRDGVVLVTPISATPQIPYATDLSGRVLWYLRDPSNDTTARLFRPVQGGSFLVVLDRDELGQQVLREVDITGQVIKETSAPRINEQLIDLGFTDPFTSFHHEAIRLPNGHTAVLGANERFITLPQSTDTVDYVGDYVVVLDQNFQVTWAWSAFDHLDIARGALLGETCGNLPENNAGCPPILLVDGDTELAADWTHSNSVAYSPSDGNLIISVRHQDWVIKIAYEDGQGNGEVVWHLGEDGDFEFANPTGSVTPWPSHQHDANYISDNQIILYDNGNARCVEFGQCFSRGQVFELDEETMTATHTLSLDLGVYSFAVGSAQVLSNGNYHFHSGIIGGFQSRIQEVLNNGALDYGITIDEVSYRSWRLVDLYSDTD